MKWVAPEYYTKFQCIADKCRHSCCIGWVIDVDEDTLAYYHSIEGAFGERLQKGIDADGETAHFIMGEGERCPFLNRSGLCDIITELGEESLCQICTDHPRFRNFYADRTEIGLGLCCEAAGALILKQKEKMKLVVLGEDDEPEEADDADKSLLDWREELILLAQNREMPITERAEAILRAAEMKLPARTDAQWADSFLALERLEEDWTVRLQEWKETDISAAPALLDTEEWETAFEQLLVYFLYRQLPLALDDGEYEGRAAFAVLSVRVIYRLCQVHTVLHGGITLDDLVEIARQYSAEVEYSDENTEAVLDAVFA